MLTTQRRQHILDVLKRDGRAIAGDLARELGLSEDTIRRDMRDMAAAGLLRRVHGGALPITPELPDFSSRRSVASSEKAKLGALALSLIKPGQTIFFDGGTTTAEIARRIPRDMAITVATHSPTIAAEFEHHDKVEVILIGGRLYRHSMVSVGVEAALTIDRLRPDIFFLGVTAIHPVHGLTTGDYEEAAIKRRIMERSRETFVPVTDDKIGAVSPCLIAPVETVTGVLVDAATPVERLDGLKETGVRLISG
ncbi:DeoR/GlpR transcriptional regulator [Ciceribacter sp. L1K23]|uniref:DeoR/GlpR family DNA-binding transcription regulator n=1 Tax=Ciceribacter sp. L1K23 TaxID=2820276 RepID=UPI001B8108A0|nr:DeoR/GlpR family DNA-binding transcription regulator [Ciceribacter sp. L1K23]MBR0556379.1 DeoR/GlpR transcriptional regulator [Ciceribacter sp. L1K23]